MNDIISRQAAIDALAELARDRFTVQDVYQVYLDALKDADMRIRQLPTAQQEIIRCKDCKYNDLEEQNSTTRWLPCIDAAWPDDWFCGCAERREDG